MKKIEVLGSEYCKTCSGLKDKIAEIIVKQNIDATVEKITDINELMKYGVISAPALVIDGELKCSGRIPKDPEIIAWLK